MMQRKMAPSQVAWLNERPTPEIMRAELKIKIQLSMKVAMRIHRLGGAKKWVSGLEAGLRVIRSVWKE